MATIFENASYTHHHRGPTVMPKVESLAGQTTSEAIITGSKMSVGAKILANSLYSAKCEMCTAHSSPIILRIGPVQIRLGLSRSSIYALLDPKSPSFDPTFPKPIRIATRAVGWVESEISEWLSSRIKSHRLGDSNG